MMDVENFNSAAAVAAVASAASAASAVLGHQQPHPGSGNGSQNQQSSPGGGSTGTALGVANKNPFAIQELLGLGSNDHQVRRALISGKKLAC